MYIAVAILALTGIAIFAIYQWGRFSDKADIAKKDASNEKKTADVFAEPKPANWNDTVDGL